MNESAGYGQLTESNKEVENEALAKKKNSIIKWQGKPVISALYA